MESLSSILLSGADPEGVVNDLARLLDQRVAGLSGLKGLAAKAGFAALKSAKPHISTSLARRYLPDLVAALDPLYQDFRKSRVGDFGVFLDQHADRATAAVMALLDARIGSLPPSTGVKLFGQFRGVIEKEFSKALPALGRTIATHA